MPNKNLDLKIPPALLLAAKMGIAFKFPTFKTYLKDLLTNRVDAAAELLRKLNIKPEEVQAEMSEDISEVAVGYITQGKINEAAELHRILNISSEQIKNILILVIKEQVLNPNHTNVRSFIDKRDFAFNVTQLKEDLRIKEIVNEVTGNLKKLTFSPNGRDLQSEAKKLGEIFGIKAPASQGEKKNDFGFGGGFDYPKFDDKFDDFDDLKI